jgi:CheY-like chemotaxis protein
MRGGAKTESTFSWRVFEARMNLEPSRILLVDDEDAFRYAVSETLKNAGHAVIVAEDYREALRRLEGDDRIDLLITDVVMPNRVNGFALARMARMRRPDLKVIYLTAYDLPTTEAIGKVLRKPISDGALLDEVHDTLTAAPDRD